jgi:putative oxidoreductase
MAHGLAKWHRGPESFAKLLELVGTPFPGATAWLITLLEVFGGLAILVGALVAIVSVPLILSMIGAVLTVQGRYGFSSVNTIGLTSSGMAGVVLDIEAGDRRLAVARQIQMRLTLLIQAE